MIRSGHADLDVTRRQCEDENMRATLERMATAAFAANGVRLETPMQPAPTPPVQVQRALPAAPADRPSLREAVTGKKRATTNPDRVVVLGSCGVLVRVRDGRLPRDGDVQPDGACLRLVVPRIGGVLVAGSLRARPTDGVFRWAAPAEMHRVDLHVVRTVAPGALAEHEAQARIADLAAQLMTMMGGVSSGSTEADLRAALAHVRR